MPDHRLRGATAYSTNKSTLANRKRLGSMPTDQRLELRKKTSEYQAIWQLLNRVCRKDDYRRATRATQRTILQASCEALLEKRRREGKAMCAIDTATMIERHLKKESATRQFSRQTASSANLPNPLNLKGVALDPSPHASRDPLSPPGTPEEEEEQEQDEEGILDKGAEGGGKDFDFETLKSENDGEQRGQSMEDFDAALDAQLQGHSHFLMTNGILSSLQSQIRSLRKETASLRDRCDSLQRQITGDQYSNTDGDDDGMHDGMAAVARYNHAMYPFPSIQPFWTAAPCQPLQSHEQNGKGHADGQEWETVDGQQQQQQQEHEGQMEGQQAQGDWVLLGPQPYSMG